MESLLEEKLTELRLEIDSVAQLTANLGSNAAACMKKLYFAKAWLGKLKGEIGVETPYKNDGKRKATKDIEPTNDKTQTAEAFVPGTNPVQAIDILREKITPLANKVKDLTFTVPPSREGEICRANAWTYLSEARIELGFLLEMLGNQKLNHE